MPDFQNSIQTFQTDFKEDTGLDYKTNIDSFIQYVQARLLYEWMQQQKTQMSQLIEEVRKLFPWLIVFFHFIGSFLQRAGIF